MPVGREAHHVGEVDPQLGQARQTAGVAHGVVVKFQEMGLPRSLDPELARLSTDLGDLWSAQKALADRLEGLMKSSDDWEAVGDHLVDIRTTLDHMSWHLSSVRRPISRITQFAYRKALE